MYVNTCCGNKKTKTKTKQKQKTKKNLSKKAMSMPGD